MGDRARKQLHEGDGRRETEEAREAEELCVVSREVDPRRKGLPARGKILDKSYLCICTGDK